MKTMTKTFGSLFAGVGGFDMGFEQAGFECLFQVEWDKHCQNVLNRNWPDIPKWGDVQDVNGAELPPCDVIIFGSPCQDLSVAGKQTGLGGEKSSMFFEAIRVIKEMRNETGTQYPKVAVWENVPGALSSNKGEDFKAVLNEMGDCGAHIIEWAVLDAQHFGVPQRRRRIFLVAIFDPTIASRCPDPLFPVAEGRRGDYSKGVPKGQDTSGTLSKGIGSGQSTAVKAKRAMSKTDFDRWEETDLSPTLNAFDNGGESRATILTFTAQRADENPRVYEDSTPTLTARMGTGGNNTPLVSDSSNFDEHKSTGVIAQTLSFGWQENHYAGDTHEEITTALTTTKTQAIHQPENAIRRLTPLECERLMGWPDDHTRWKPDGTEQADSHRYKQCGNGVATPVARWVANQITNIL